MEPGRNITTYEKRSLKQKKDAMGYMLLARKRSNTGLRIEVTVGNKNHRLHQLFFWKTGLHVVQHVARFVNSNTKQQVAMS